MAMGVPKIKVPGMCLLLLIMPLLLLPGSQGATCRELSKTYTSPNCAAERCMEHCQTEGHDNGVCEGSYFDPYKAFCFCNKRC
uniref:Knottin scorpion toxin-like domain-containing protein n=1 Tax=Hordeum vulgare subsp. vulgare TaxID=112509 RepID=A0A8I6XNH8_HORVV